MNTEQMRQHERDLEYIRGFRMIDDDFMKMVFDNKAAVKELLKIILGNDDFEIVTYKVEYVVPNYKGRGIRIDVYAKILRVKTLQLRYRGRIREQDLSVRDLSAVCLTHSYQPPEIIMMICLRYM